MDFRFNVSAKSLPHGGQDFFRKSMLPTRTESREERSRQHLSGYGFIDCRLQGPSTFSRILDEAGIGIETRIFRESGGREVEKPGGDYAAAPPHLGDIRNVEVEPFSLWRRLGRGVFQDIETLSIGLHKAVFDPVMHHLDEMARTGRSGVDIAALDTRIAAVSARGSRHVALTRSEGGKDRIEAVDYVLLAADHHAVAALQTPHAATCSNIDVVQAAFTERSGAANIVLPEGIAAVDDDIIRLEHEAKLADRVFGDFTGRQHQPDRAGPAQLAHEIFQPSGWNCPFVGQSHNGLRHPIVHDHFMAMPYQAARDVAAHSPKSDNADL